MQDNSARDALNTFLARARATCCSRTRTRRCSPQQKGGQAEYFNIPKATIRIDNPSRVTTSGKNKPAAKAFVKFLYTPTAQKLFAAQRLPAGREERRARATSFPVRPQLFTVELRSAAGRR